MLLDNKYEIKFKLDLSEFTNNNKLVQFIIIIPKNLKNRGILDQLKANALGEIIDDFPLN